jgi:hypothetical protein
MRIKLKKTPQANIIDEVDRDNCLQFESTPQEFVTPAQPVVTIPKGFVSAAQRPSRILVFYVQPTTHNVFYQPRSGYRVGEGHCPSPTRSVATQLSRTLGSRFLDCHVQRTTYNQQRLWLTPGAAGLTLGKAKLTHA